MLVFAPSRDQHNVDSFHRKYVKQSKKKSLLEHFLVVSRNLVRVFNCPKAHSIRLPPERSTLLKIQHLKIKDYILSNSKVSGGTQDHLYDSFKLFNDLEVFLYVSSVVFCSIRSRLYLNCKLFWHRGRSQATCGPHP